METPCIKLRKEQVKKLLDVLQDAEDRGPKGQGWQSPELIELIEQIENSSVNLNKLELFVEINEELTRAKKIHPEYPINIFEQLAIMQEEAGEVTRAVNQLHEGKGSIAHIREELIQTAAMCVRMLENI